MTQQIPDFKRYHLQLANSWAACFLVSFLFIGLAQCASAADNEPVFFRSENKTYRVVHKLGSGGRGSVYKVKLIGSDPPQFFAIKQLKRTANSIYQLPVGYRQLHKLSDKQKKKADRIHFATPVLGTSSVSPDVPFAFLIMPIAKENANRLIDEYELLRKLPKEEVSERLRKIAILADQMTMAVEQVRKLGFVHHDVKPENFLVPRSREQLWNGKAPLKLADHDLLRKFGRYSTSGTSGFMAPETEPISAGHRSYYFPESNEFTDRFSLGMSIYHLIFGQSAQVQYMAEKKGLSFSQARQQAHRAYDDSRGFDDFIVEKFNELASSLKLNAKQKQELFALRNRVLGAIHANPKKRTIDGTIKRYIRKLGLLQRLLSSCTNLFETRQYRTPIELPR